MKFEKSLRARAMDLLSRREMSRLELKRKLMAYADDEQALEQVLNEFSERNWQSDERYTEVFINSKSRKHGSLRLKQSLQAKGIDSATIQAHLPDKNTELDNAKEVLHKKFKNPAQSAAEKQKQLRFLLYRGFSMDIALSAMKADWDDFSGSLDNDFI